MSERGAIKAIEDAAALIDKLCEDLYEWKAEFGSQATEGVRQYTTLLIEEAYYINKKLRGDY